MKIKKVALLSSVVALSALGLSSCGSSNEYPNGVVNVYNWGEYIDETLIEKFETETGIDVVYDTFDSNESMYVKLKNGGVNYDIAIPSDYMIEKMKKEDMLEPIDYNNITNYQYIREDLKSLPFDVNNEYSVPYFWGTVGILYNKDMIDEEVNSWDILWDEKHKGKIFMYDSQRDSLAVALKKLGYSLNSTDETELKEAQQLLFDQKPLVQAYVGDTVRDKMIGEEGSLAVVYSGDAMYCMNENANLAYAIPKEGSNTWVDSMVIPKGAGNKENAEKFINFMTDPTNALQNSEYVGYSTTNEETYKNVSDDVKALPVYWPTKEDLANNEFYVSLDTAASSLYDKIWTEVLAHN